MHTVDQVFVIRFRRANQQVEMSSRIAVRSLLLLTILPVCAAKAADVPTRPSQGKGGAVGTLENETVKIRDQARHYRLIVPKGLDVEKPCPLVFAYHGLGDGKDLMPWYSKLPELAEKEKFILVFPNGLNKSWPIIPILAGGEYAFFDTLYESLTAKYNVDLNRVYLTGMSNGAYFCTVLAAVRSDKIAAIAPHSGGLGAFSRRGVKAPHKYGVFIAHGADDSIVKVDEGRKLRDVYTREGHAVEYLEIPSHNHFWGTKADVNGKLWKFFVEHPLQADPEKKPDPEKATPDK